MINPVTREQSCYQLGPPTIHGGIEWSMVAQRLKRQTHTADAIFCRLLDEEEIVQKGGPECDAAEKLLRGTEERGTGVA